MDSERFYAFHIHGVQLFDFTDFVFFGVDVEFADEADFVGEIIDGSAVGDGGEDAFLHQRWAVEAFTRDDDGCHNDSYYKHDDG